MQRHREAARAERCGTGLRPTMTWMPTLADVFKELNALKEERVISDYALGGATAILFYAEPTSVHGSSWSREAWTGRSSMGYLKGTT